MPGFMRRQGRGRGRGRGGGGGGGGAPRRPNATSGSGSSNGNSSIIAASATSEAPEQARSGDGSIDWTTGEHRPTNKGLAEIYDDHAQQNANLSMDLGRHQYSVDAFTESWQANRSRYESVASAAGVPAELVAAIHFRESSGNFNTYLHNGEPLGKVTTLVPAGIYFENWEEAAVDALERFAWLRDATKMDAETRDLAAMATFAEHFNGLGYRDYRGHQSPYVYSGTTAYERGKYVADGQYSGSTVDSQLGVIPMVRLAAGDLTPAELEGENDLWMLGDRTLRDGLSGSDVRQLQLKLNEAGYPVGVDGNYGPGTAEAVRRFQQDYDLGADGIAGPDTLDAIGATSYPASMWGFGGSAFPVTKAVELREAGTAIPGLTTKTLTFGASGEDVRTLQRMLLDAGHQLIVDGNFGPATETAVRAFQARNGLEADGIVGPKTREVMSGASFASGSLLSAGPVPPSVELAFGDRGDQVAALQRSLNHWGSMLTVDGNFGPNTQAALMLFQADAGLSQTGQLDRPTLNHMKRLSSTYTA
ncbi:MAG: peptidoglycan-binding domain-containing protein [Myxococcota bacterium]